ncbi:MAG TPA: amidohydrolase [Gammaproteobacteria bacterium]|jgi:hypothetical protein
MRLAALLLVLLASPAYAATGDLILRDGAIYTLDAKRPWASVIAIHDGKIAFVGEYDETALTPYLKGARIVDLHGAMVLPGFHDSHVHPLAGAIRLLQCDLTTAKSLDDIGATIKAFAAANKGQPWVFCNNLDRSYADGLNRERLDAWMPDRPVFVRTTEGFLGWMNSTGLKAVGIDPEGTGAQSPDLPRDADHHPWGVMMGSVLVQARSKIPAPSATDYREALRRFGALANSYGITSVFDAAAAPEMLDTYHAADLAGALTLRVTAAQRVDPDKGLDQVDAMVERRAQLRGKRFHADAAKIFLDGEIDQYTAARLPHGGINQPQLDEMVQELDAEGFLIHMHAMGDGAVRAGLDAFEHAALRHGPADRRDQIAHVGVADPQDIPRFAKLGVIADFTPLWFQQGDAAFQSTIRVLGDRARWMYPMGSVVATGAHVTIGSDWPQETFKPLDEIQYAVTRQPLDGSPPSTQPEQRITLEQALAAYTREGAYAVREEKLDGTLEVGKAADIVVLDQNLFKIDVMSIHKTRVLLTLLDGAPVYCDSKFELP